MFAWLFLIYVFIITPHLVLIEFSCPLLLEAQKQSNQKDPMVSGCQTGADKESPRTPNSHTVTPAWSIDVVFSTFKQIEGVDQIGEEEFIFVMIPLPP